MRIPAELPDELAVTCQALQLLLPECGLDGVTAAHALDLPLPWGIQPDDPFVVTIEKGAGQRRLPGVRVHRDAECDRELLERPNGLVLECPEQIWRRLTMDDRLEVDDLVVLADALRNSFPTRTFDTVVPRGALARAKATEAWQLSRANVRSSPETRLRLAIVRAGLPEPVVNQDVNDEAGGWLACPDLSWPAVRVAVEYDSQRHRDDLAQWNRDKDRDRLVRRQDWVVIVVTGRDMGSRLSERIAEIAETLRARGLSW